MSWIPLRVHSQYSILDASSSIASIVKKAKHFAIPACALTDHGNLFGAIEFYKACKEAGIKPILGCEFYVSPLSRFDKKKDAFGRAAYPLTLLAKNHLGYQNLAKLSSLGFFEGYYYYPRIDYELLERYKEGLICLEGGVSSLLFQKSQEKDPSSFYSHIASLKALFQEDYFLELQRHQSQEHLLEQDGMHKEFWLIQQYEDLIKKENLLNSRILEACKKENILPIATNDSHYMEREDWRAHEVLLNVQSGEPCEIWERDSQGNLKNLVPNPKRRTYASHEYYFKSPKEMEALFSDIPEAIHNTLILAEKCQIEINFKAKHYPVYTPPQKDDKETGQTQTPDQFLWNLCKEGIPKKYTKERLAKIQELFPDQDPMEIVLKRLDYEMGVIVPKAMCDYLLIVWDFIHWAKNNGIPVGPGRGSGAGSIILYLIGITDIEPLRFHLFFERFINPERISYPDIDVDICMEKRGEVIQYTLQKYGKENVAQIITFGTMKARMSIKDVGRALNIPLTKVNAICKLIPEDLNITLEKALEKDIDLKNAYTADPEVKRVYDLAKKLEGSIRNTGIHAAGIIISGEPLTNHIPICFSKDSDMPVTQYSMKPVEQVGMLKVDFLGLTTLTAIQKCVLAIQESTGISIDWVNLSLDDAKTFKLLNQGKTLGVFQLESSGMQDLAKQLHIDKFEEIIAVGALYRPGPMDMIPSFINRKHGREPIEYDHPWMEEILSETYGIMVYQEQVMQIASKLAKYSLGEGDVLRRAMGKKDAQEMAKQREKFKNGAKENGISEELALHIFDKVEKFASYGFNKSHAAAYAYLTYVTAYLKANYPKEWLAALMSCASDDTVKIAKFIGEGKSMGIHMLPPDVNESKDTFVATPFGIRFALTGIKGVGSNVVESIILEREKNGPFTSLYSFLKRIDTKKVGKKSVEHLIDAGSFDFTDWTRDALRENLDSMYNAAIKEQQNEQKGILTLFSLMGETEELRFVTPPPVKTPSSRHQILIKEKSLLGFYLTGHPMDEFKEILNRLSCIPLSTFHTMNHDTVFRSAFLVETLQTRISSKSQKKFAILMISDGVERFELPIWPDLYEEKGFLLQENQLLYAVLQVENKDDAPKLSCRWFDDLTLANEAMIDACDAAFEKAKSAIFRFANREKNSSNPKKGVVKMEATTPKVPAIFHLHFNLNEMSLKSILTLKKIFQEHRGDTPLVLNFLNGTHKVASIHIDSKWGIHLTDAFKQALNCANIPLLEPVLKPKF